MRDKDFERHPKGKKPEGDRARDGKRPPRDARPAGSADAKPWREHPGAGRGKPDVHPRKLSDAPNRPGRGPGDRPFRKKTWRPVARDRDGPIVLYGWHSVKAALENPDRKFHRVLLTENALRRLEDDSVVLPIKPEIVRPDEIDALLGPDAVHQGLMAEADALDGPDIEELEPRGIILVLDQITDPHNVGALLRSAAAFGVEAVVTTVRHSPEATGVLAKAASGALDYMPLVTVPNLARALDVLKDKFVMCVGLDSTGESDLAALPLTAPLAIVLGAEGKGLRHLTRTKCDAVARLDLPGRIKSLNVSNATALALYVARMKIPPTA